MVKHRIGLPPIVLRREGERQGGQHVEGVVQIRRVLRQPHRRHRGKPPPPVHDGRNDLVAASRPHNGDVGGARVALRDAGLNDRQLVLQRAHFVTPVQRRAQVLALDMELNGGPRRRGHDAAVDRGSDCTERAPRNLVAQDRQVPEQDARALGVLLLDHLRCWRGQAHGVVHPREQGLEACSKGGGQCQSEPHQNCQGRLGQRGVNCAARCA